MIHDQDLLDKLGAISVEKYEGDVFRATGISADPLASSVSGGRWAPPAGDGVDVRVLYTSLEREGALAEVVSYLALLTPLPSKPLKVARLEVSTARTLRLARVELEALGVDMARYGERDYGQTQKIGAALAFLGLDGLIAPSARWTCSNLMIFTANSHPAERLEIGGVEHVDWRRWARANGFLAEQAPPAARCHAAAPAAGRTGNRSARRGEG